MQSLAAASSPFRRHDSVPPADTGPAGARRDRGARGPRDNRLHHRLRPVALALVIAAVWTGGVRPAAAQLRLVSWNVAGLAGNTDAIRETFAIIATDDLSDFAVAPHLILMQEVESGNQNTLRVLAEQATGLDYAIATYTNASEDGSGGAQALLYRPDSLAEVTAGHRDLITGAGRRADRWRMRWLAADEAEGTIWVYSAHLKASPGESNEAQRLEGARVLRDDIATIPAGANIILVGDLNLYSNLEPAFAELLEPGPNPLFDPLGGGSWDGPGNAIKHSQSPRASAGGGLVGGGLDDRFDFVLPSITLDDGNGLAVLVETYRSVGNDGQHYNTSINDGTNTYFPDDIPTSNALADALFVASDHLPVLVDFAVPAVLEATLPTDLGRVIRGASFLVPASFENATPVQIASATDQIFISWTTTGALVGGGVALANPLDGPQSLPAALVTPVAGVVTGTIELTTEAEGVLDPFRSLPTQATVLRPVDPSFAAKGPVTEFELDVTATVDGPPVDIDVTIHNLGFDDLQSRLDLDSVDGLADGLALDGPLATGAGELAILPLRFDPTGLVPGIVEVPLVLTVSDEDLPGETTRALQLLVRVTVDGDGNPYDLDGDGTVGFNDLLAVLSAFGPCPAPPADCPADFDASGAVDFGDLLEILAAFGG
jgi:endonuclease/exonuclease/phosphatase family metal-dependent hydrolase